MKIGAQVSRMGSAQLLGSEVCGADIEFIDLEYTPGNTGKT